MGIENLYRNSSEKAAGFTFEGGFMREDRDRSTNLREQQDRTTDTARCRLPKHDQRHDKRMEAQLDDQVADREHLIERAHKSWDRACDLYPEFKDQLDTQLEEIKTEFTNRICQAELMWQRTAGSSLNCLVQDMKMKAEIELARQLSETLANSLIRFREHQTAALQQAFQKEFMAHHQQAQMVFGHIGNMLVL